MMEWLTNPWVIIVIVLSVIIGNIAALKYTAKMKFNVKNRRPKTPSADKLDENEENKKDPQ
ncbi:DUF2897 family protein [Vibrio nereis]|nr:DUF2897 family protein [Vibrio nereis]